MSLKTGSVVFLICFLTYLAFDLVWLRYVAGPFYQSRLDSLLAENPRLTPALIFYCLFVLGNLVFVVEPAVRYGSIVTVLLKGSFYGLVCYATYDLTNYATLNEWPLSVTLLDMAWGVGISTLIGWVGFYASGVV